MKNLQIIHRLLDNTYSPPTKSATFSLRHNMHGSTVVINYSTIVHFASEKSLTPQVETARDHARQIIKDAVDKLKKQYKEETDATLKFKDRGEQDNIELIQATSNSPRKIAYYRYSQTIDFND